MSFTLPLSRHYDPVTHTFTPPLDIWEITLGRRENPLDFLFDEEAAEAELDRQLAEVDRIKAWKPMGRDIDPTLTWMIGYDGTTEEDDYEEAT
jgi:hypothetical protein